MAGMGADVLRIVDLDPSETEAIDRIVREAAEARGYLRIEVRAANPTEGRLARLLALAGALELACDDAEHGSEDAAALAAAHAAVCTVLERPVAS